MLTQPLSKTALQQGSQCQRMLWIKYNIQGSNIKSAKNEAEQEQYKIGNIVGEAARKYFNDGKTVTINTSRGFNSRNYEEYAEETRTAMSDPAITTIAEATFYTGDIVVFIDLLHRNDNDSWDIYEVKSGNKVTPVHARDAMWQTYVAKNLCGAHIANTYLMHPKAGWSIIADKNETDANDFEIVDMFSNWIKSESAKPETEQKIADLINMLQEKEPPKCCCSPGRGECCVSPYKCDFTITCQKLAEIDK